MKWLMTVLCAALLSGCLNVYTRLPTTNPRIESVYQSTRTAVAFAIVGSFPQMMSDNPGDHGFRWGNCFSILFIGLPCAVDALCEAVIDTALLPCDWILSNQRKETNQ